jgi:hypothetical protein
MLDLVNPLSGARDLLKFSIRFVDEGAEQEKDWQRIDKYVRLRLKKHPS